MGFSSSALQQKVKGSGFRVEGLGFRVQGLGFSVLGPRVPSDTGAQMFPTAC